MVNTVSDTRMYIYQIVRGPRYSGGRGEVRFNDGPLGNGATVSLLVSTKYDICIFFGYNAVGTAAIQIRAADIPINIFLPTVNHNSVPRYLPTVGNIKDKKNYGTSNRK